jgi:membrane associated rhomboid family serine protease
MGYQDRYYAGDNWSPRRDESGSSGVGFADWEVWKKLIAINIAVFLLQIFITRPASEEDLVQLPQFDPEMYREYDQEFHEQYGYEESREQMRQQLLQHMPRVSVVQKWCELDSDKVKHGQVWRLVTAGFCHDRMAIWHLAFNMLFLFWFGKRLERIYGAAEFTAFYFTALVVSSLAYIGLDLYTDTHIPAIGASGAVWGVVAVYALMYPYERVHVYFLFPIEIRWLVLLYFIFDLHPVLLALAGERQFTGVAHAAHIGGAIFGFLYWQQSWRLMPLVERLRWVNRDATILSFPRARSRRRNASTQCNTERMDEILTKISEQGRDSLTDEEREILEESSRRIRQNRRQP